MPELPEVETVKRVLIPIVKGRRILDVEILRNNIVLDDNDYFINNVKNEVFLDVSRIGKFLIFHLTNDKVIISHLRMEGKYFEYLEEEEHRKYARVIFHLDNNHKLVYDDTRCFGLMKLSTEKDYLQEKEIAKLGPEPFAIKDVTYLLDSSKKSNEPTKTALLDQTLMTGLGNIYVDETLFKAKIHPLTPIKDLTKEDWENIVKYASETLLKAIELGGSTIKSYHPGKNIDGEFQNELVCYGKSGEKCPRCGTIMKFSKVGGRGTTICPHCQILKKKQLIIGVTGKIASGKSTLTSLIKEEGYPVIDCDEIVEKLYKNDGDLRVLLENTFNISFNGKEIDKSILRDYLNEHPKDIKILNALVHPRVKKEIIKEIKDMNSAIIFVEVPLLFESKMEKMFDYIIALDIDEELQKERLLKRNPESAAILLSINKRNNEFKKYKKKVDLILVNNGDIDTLKKSVINIIKELKTHLIS